MQLPEDLNLDGGEEQQQEEEQGAGEQLVGVTVLHPIHKKQHEHEHLEEQQEEEQGAGEELVGVSRYFFVGPL